MADINSYYKNIKKNYTKDNFVRVTENNFNEIKETFNKTVKPGITETYEQMKNRLNNLGLSIQNLYFSKGYYEPFTYKDEFYYSSNDWTYKDSLMLELSINSIKKSIESVNDLVKENNFQHLFMFVDPKYHILLLEDVYDMIPGEQKYNIFKFIYTNSDYGLHEINHEIVKDLFMLNLDKPSVNNLKVDKEGYVTIYRGTENLSSPLERAYSWTWDRKIAEFFANRFKTDTGILYKAKVKKENIIDYINERKEKEILVFPEYVEDIRIIKKYNK